MTVLAKYAGHAGHVRQRALTLPEIFVRQDSIFTGHQLSKMSGWGSKCPAEH